MAGSNVKLPETIRSCKDSCRGKWIICGGAFMYVGAVEEAAEKAGEDEEMA